MKLKEGDILVSKRLLGEHRTYVKYVKIYKIDLSETFPVNCLEYKASRLPAS